MKIVASLIVRSELGRYLEPCIASLQTFCDEIRVLDDHSRDGSYEWLLGRDKVYVLTNTGPEFFANEGAARNALLDWTLEGEPTHVLAIDADEFIADGRALRAAIDHDDLHPVWTITMQEIWKADPERLWIRQDGGWRGHDAPILWRVPDGGMKLPDWRIQSKALSCGREPVAVREQFRNALRSGTQILHFGWTNEAGRQARYERYVEHDGGKFHASSHLRSIMDPDRKVRLAGREWPAGLLELREAILERVAA